MTEIKPKARWRLNVFHLFLILTSYLAPTFGGVHFVYDYIKLTLPLYVFFTLVMLLPHIPFSIRILSIIIGIMGYALLRARMTFQSTTGSIAAGEEATISLLIIMSSMLIYAIFIVAGYPAFRKLSVIKKIFILIGSALSHIPATILAFFFISMLSRLFYSLERILA